jgi:phage terminase small subunit
VNAIGSQFGWSPVSRVRLHAIAAGEEKKNDFEDFTK